MLNTRSSNQLNLTLLCYTLRHPQLTQHQLAHPPATLKDVFKAGKKFLQVSFVHNATPMGYTKVILNAGRSNLGTEKLLR